MTTKPVFSDLLWHLSIPAAGLRSWPGCMSPAIRSRGWSAIWDEVRLAKQCCPMMGGFLLDNPFGKHRLRTDPDNTSIQTLVDQYLRALETPGLERVIEVKNFHLMIDQVRDAGLGAEIYMGFPEEDIEPNRLGQSMWPYFSKKLGVWFDGSGGARGPWDEWILEKNLEWGGAFSGVEAAPGTGSHMDQERFPSISTEIAFRNQGGVEGARRRRGRSSMLWRGQSYMPIEEVVTIMRSGIRIYAGLANWNRNPETQRQIDILNETARSMMFPDHSAPVDPAPVTI